MHISYKKSSNFVEMAIGSNPRQKVSFLLQIIFAESSFTDFTLDTTAKIILKQQQPIAY